MKLSSSSLVLALASVLAVSTGCVMGTSRAPVGRSTTTGGVVCPSGYEPSRNGDCVLTPNNSASQDAFR